jgi:hypothetical protein
MCVILLGWATNQTFFKDLTDTNFRQKLLNEKAKVASDDALPFGLIDDGMDDGYEDDRSGFSDFFHTSHDQIRW